MGLKIFNFSMFWGFQRNEYFFGGMKILWIFLGVYSHNWVIFKGHLYALEGLFIRSRYIMGDIFGGC